MREDGFIACLEYNTSEDNTTKEDGLTSWDSPPPSYFSSQVELVSETVARKELEVSQQQFNTDSTVVQHSEIVDLTKNAPSQDEVKNTDTQ